MFFPNSAKEALKKAFYDKTIEVLTAEGIIDEEGGVKKGELIVKSTFRGNVQFTNLGEIQSELGLIDAIDVCITCANTESIAVNDLLRYDGRLYRATSVLPSDSHLTIVGNLCRK